ncbi:hypothetical protein F4808DRAFT_459097 [Astrocystis sublimbata]|nr:hypothetical protein F4808DRAFT_459097 [Astrocystis sublimbata]
MGEANEEIKLKKEVEMAKAAVAAAELEAKLEAARKIAVREAEKKQEEETEMRKIQKAEAEKRERREDETRALESLETKEEAAFRRTSDNGQLKRLKRIDNPFRRCHGAQYAVPFSQGRSWEGMQELINAAFIPVERLWPAVREGHYDRPNGDTVDSEPDISVEEQRDDDTSSGYQSSSIVSWKPSRTMRIRNAFTALKNSILRKKRRRRDSWASTSSSGDASRSSSEAIND